MLAATNIKRQNLQQPRFLYLWRNADNTGQTQFNKLQFYYTATLILLSLHLYEASTAKNAYCRFFMGVYRRIGQANFTYRRAIGLVAAFYYLGNTLGHVLFYGQYKAHLP